MASDVEAKTPMHGPNDGKILVVEDDPRMRDSLRDLLRLHGFDVSHSATLNGALTAATAADFALVLLDLKLDDQSGFILMDYLAIKKADTRFIVITGQPSDSFAITALRKGASDYLKKPVEPDDLLRSVSKVLQIRRERRERRQIQHWILNSRERFRHVVDSQKDYLCRLNRDLEVTFANKAFALHCGRTPQTLIGRAYPSLLAETLQHDLVRTLEAVRSGARPMVLEYKQTTADGRRRYQRWRFHGVPGTHGAVEEIQCLGRDVTQERTHLNRLEEKTDKFRNLAEITSDWIWEVDKKGVYTYASPVVSELLGYRPEEVVGKRPFDFMPAAEARRLETMFQRVLERGRPFRSIENVNLHKNGSPVTLESSGVPIFDAAGELIGYRGVDRNISARKLAEKRLHEETDKLKQALAKVNRLSGMLPICASCKMIRDDKGYWSQLEAYISEHSDAEFSHGLCPGCARKLYPELY